MESAIDKRWFDMRGSICEVMKNYLPCTMASPLPSRWTRPPIKASFYCGKNHQLASVKFFYCPSPLPPHPPLAARPASVTPSANKAQIIWNQVPLHKGLINTSLFESARLNRVSAAARGWPNESYTGAKTRGASTRVRQKVAEVRLLRAARPFRKLRDSIASERKPLSLKRWKPGKVVNLPRGNQLMWFFSLFFF